MPALFEFVTVVEDTLEDGTLANDPKEIVVLATVEVPPMVEFVTVVEDTVVVGIFTELTVELVELEEAELDEGK